MRYFVIERELPGVGSMTNEDLGGAARTSNAAIALVPGVQWQHSYVAADKTFCVYLAEDEAAIRQHARLSGFPANGISEVFGIIDPATERFCHEATAAGHAPVGTPITA